MSKILGKRSYASYRGAKSYTPGRKRVARGRKYRTGNSRSGGLYRLRGRTIRGRGRSSVEKKAKDLEITWQSDAVADTAYEKHWRTADNNFPSGTTLNHHTWYHTWPLEGISQGTGFNQRIGRKINIKSLQFKGAIDLDYSYPNDNDKGGDIDMRIMLVLDSQANGTRASVKDILQNTSGSDGAISGGLAIYQLSSVANQQRFRILYDKHHKINQSNDYNSRIPIKLFKKCNFGMEYGGTDGNTNEIKTNNLILMYCYERAIGSNANIYATIYGTMRFRYTDQ